MHLLPDHCCRAMFVLLCGFLHGLVSKFWSIVGGESSRDVVLVHNMLYFVVECVRDKGTFRVKIVGSDRFCLMVRFRVCYCCLLVSPRGWVIMFSLCLCCEDRVEFVCCSRVLLGASEFIVIACLVRCCELV